MTSLDLTRRLPTPIALVGLGMSNRALEKLLLVSGFTPDSILHFDDKIADGVLNDPELLKERGVKTLIVSPGYPLAKEWIVSLRAEGVLVTSELAVAGSLLEDEKLIGITGSLGKSTTASLVGVGLEAAGKRVFVGGNLGFPLADYVLQVNQGTRARAEWVVLELSSFQLENLGALHFDCSLFTYFCSNHLERYSGLEEYYQTKASLLPRTKQRSFGNAQSRELVQYFKSYSLDQIQWSDLKSQKLFTDNDWSKKSLVGTHNQENLSLVASLLNELGVWNDSVKNALLAYKGLPHRMELLATKGPFFINDSKATAMESVRSAVQSVLDEKRFQEGGGKLWVLLGGRDKKLPWNELSSLGGLAQSLGEARLGFMFFGECRATVASASGLKGLQADSLRKALELLRSQTQSQDWVLLSPGGTSLDEFINFEDRGRMFAQWVKDIWK